MRLPIIMAWASYFSELVSLGIEQGYYIFHRVSCEDKMR